MTVGGNALDRAPTAPFIFAAWLLAAGAVVDGGAFAAEIQRYVDPQGKFSLDVPSGAQAAKPAENFDVSIQSRKGYVITVQSGPVKREYGLRDLLGMLEERYLGPLKPWRVKLSEESSLVGSMPAIGAVYESARSRLKTVIVRGRETDFVIIFSAAANQYDTLVPEFHWLLASFRGASGDGAEVATAAVPPWGEETTRFSDPTFGYSIEYPAQWVLSKPSPFTLVLNGPQGSDAAEATIGIQNVKPNDAQGPEEAVAAALNDLKTGLAAGTEDLSIISEGLLTYSKNGLTLQGHQFVATFSQGGRRFTQWTMIVPRPVEAVAHVLSYFSPEPHFQSFLPIAQAVLLSWTIETSAN